MIGSLFAAAFLSMTIYICYYAATHQEELFENDYNQREEKILSQNSRGNIYSAEGYCLARTAEYEDGSSERLYPYGNLFSHIVGYDVLGRSGVEALMNRELIASDLTIAQKTVYDDQGAKYPGNDVYTTLDVTLQQAASDALGIYKGAIIVTEVGTGKILACVSKPDFDPQTVASQWSSLVEDNESGKLVNRATQGEYAPGSKFKIIDSIEYLEEHDQNISAYSYQCGGNFTLDGNTIHCYHNEVHGSVSFESSFAKSCNCSFANIGTGLDRTSFEKTLNALYFNRALPFDLSCSVSSASLSASSTADDVMQLSIGQGKTTMSPLHLNMITAMIANGGEMMKPYVVDRVTTAQGNTVTQYSAVSLGQLISKETAETMTQLMRSVVTSGTGTKLRDASYEAAGKTGSAEFEEGTSNSHAWFTGFAPVSDPQICVTVVIEGAGSGGDYAVPMAKRVFDAWYEESRS